MYMQEEIKKATRKVIIPIEKHRLIFMQHCSWGQMKKDLLTKVRIPSKSKLVDQ